MCNALLESVRTIDADHIGGTKKLKMLEKKTKKHLNWAALYCIRGNRLIFIMAAGTLKLSRDIFYDEYAHMACVIVTRELCNMKGCLLLYGDKKKTREVNYQKVCCFFPAERDKTDTVG